MCNDFSYDDLTVTEKLRHECLNAGVNIFSLARQIIAQEERFETAVKRFPLFVGTKTHIILHHSLIPDGTTAQWPAIRKYHMLNLGWSDIGYHAGIEAIRYPGEYEILIGRDFFYDGAHCKEKEMNHKGYGFMFNGNFDIEVPPEKMLERAAKYLATICRLGHISPDNIEGHNKYSSKSCPGELFDIDDFRNRVVECL